MCLNFGISGPASIKSGHGVCLCLIQSHPTKRLHQFQCTLLKCRSEVHIHCADVVVLFAEVENAIPTSLPFCDLFCFFCFFSLCPLGWCCSSAVGMHFLVLLLAAYGWMRLINEMLGRGVFVGLVSRRFYISRFYFRIL